MKSSIINFTIKREESLLTYVHESQGINKDKLKKLINSRSIFLNGNPIENIDIVLIPNDRIRVNMFAAFTDLPIVFEDEYLIAVNKDYNLLTIGSEKEKINTLYHKVSTYLKKRNKNGKVFVIHRLDYDTSGLVLFAKDFKTKSLMQAAWTDTKKTYLAVIKGILTNKRNVLTDYLKENKEFEVYITDNKEEGKEAITYYEVMDEHNGYSLLHLEIKTGRKNQIRVQLRKISEGVVGDQKYGTTKSKRLYLHSDSLSFVHPYTKRQVAIKCPINFDLNKIK